MYGVPEWNFPPNEWDRKTMADYILMESNHPTVMHVRNGIMAGDSDGMPMTQCVAYTRLKLERERIVAAAIRVAIPSPHSDLNSDMLTVSAPPPARHHHLIHPIALAKTKPDDQGFLTSSGRYVGREEGLQIAMASGQPMIDHPSRHATQLFSEDLW
jgi:hypothetical protein